MTKYRGVPVVCACTIQLFLCASALRAEERDEDKKEAAVVQKVIADNTIDTISGKLVLEPVDEGKDPPKVVGTLIGAKEAYKIQLMHKDQYKDLVKFNNQTVNMAGHVIEKEDQGKTIYFENLDFAAARAPGRNKRGGF